MSAWPTNLRVGPLREWPGTLRPDSARQRSRFESTLTSTLQLLDREITHLVQTRDQHESAELLVAIEPAGFRLDGRVRAGAAATHPGVVFSIDSRHGHLSYPCDTFTTWEANLRAITLALEALRKIDRYGVTAHGEQYRGFLELEEHTAVTTAQAMRVLVDAAEMIVEDVWTYTLEEYRGVIARRAKFRTHPDRGGSRDAYDRVVAAEQRLAQKETP